MANTVITINSISFKRYSQTSVPPSIVYGEPIWCSNGKVLYIGDAGNTVVAVGGERNPGILTSNQAMVTNATGYMDKIQTSNIVVNGVGITAINTYSNDITLGSGSNSELVTSWAIMNYITESSGQLEAGNGLTKNTTHYEALANTGIVVNSAGIFTAQNINTTADVLFNSVKVGNATVNATINSTTFTGTANNSSYLGGTAAAGYQTTAGLAANVATLSANNSAYLGGLAAASYANTSDPIITNSITVGNSVTNVVTNTTAITIGGSYLNANGINVPNGATGNLSIRYAGANTGVYLSGTVLWHVTNGTARWGVGATIAGALTYAPGMRNSNSLVANTTVIYPNKQDTDTGLGAGAANTLTFIVTGNEKVRLNSNGMGINTVAPAYTLDISGTTRSTSMIIGTTDLYGNSLTFTSSTGPDVIDAIAIATFRSADYIYSMKNNSANAYQTGKILVLQNGTTGQLSEYAVQSSNGSMGTFSTGSNATHVTLLFTPGASTSYTVRFTRTALTV